MTEGSVRQTAGDYSAQASHGGTAVVNVYQYTRPAPVDEATLAKAHQRLAALPLAEVPEPASLPPGSRMPLARNPLFVGREQDLLRLAEALKGGQTAAIGQTAAATGMGGIGKTQLAGEFVHRYGQFFGGGVFWLSFADPAGVTAEVALCGGRGHLELAPDFAGLPLEDQVRLVLSAWQSPLPRLLVFDNCEDEKLLARWRPPTGGCRVLVTSRRQAWSRVLGVQALPLGVLSRAESIELLRKFRPNLTESEAKAIAGELGRLPLALHLAGSYLHRYRNSISPEAYLKQVRDKELLNHRSLRGVIQELSPTGHDLDVFRSFVVSYNRLDPAAPVDLVAARLLSRAACFAPGEPIPRKLLVAALGEVEDEEASLQVEDGLARLVELGLIETEATGALRLHRLLAAFVRLMPIDTEAQDAVEQAVIDEAYRLNMAGYPAPLLAWQVHLRYVTEAAQAWEDERAATLCTNLGYHLRMVGDYAAARPYYERALAIREKALGPEHPDTALSLNNLGLLLQAMGDYAAARLYLERALAIYEKALGLDHPGTAVSLNNLGLLLHDLGELAAARPYYERALAIYEKALGPDHPDTTRSLNNLAMLLKDQGELAAARLHLERALAIRERVLGPHHPDTALSLNNLGLLLQDLGDPAAARPYYERALAIWEKALGPDHPHTAFGLNNLGALLQELGDYATARPYYEQALAIREKLLGPDHPDAATSLNNLGYLLKAMGEPAAARPYLERALAIFEKALGPEHPNTRIVRNNLAVLSQPGSRSP